MCPSVSENTDSNTATENFHNTVPQVGHLFITAPTLTGAWVDETLA